MSSTTRAWLFLAGLSMATVTVPLLVGLGMGLYEHITGHVFVENASKGDAIDMVQIKLVQRLPQLAKANATFYRAEVGAQEPVPSRFVVQGEMRYAGSNLLLPYLVELQYRGPHAADTADWTLVRLVVKEKIPAHR